jgi:hypothetical protein
MNLDLMCSVLCNSCMQFYLGGAHRPGGAHWGGAHWGGAHRDFMMCSRWCLLSYIIAFIVSRLCNKEFLSMKFDLMYFFTMSVTAASKFYPGGAHWGGAHWGGAHWGGAH